MGFDSLGRLQVEGLIRILDAFYYPGGHSHLGNRPALFLASTPAIG
jgi:hypothetical protein